MSDYLELHVNGKPILVKKDSIVYVRQDFGSERACICLFENHNLRFDETYVDIMQLLNEAEGGKHEQSQRD